MYDHLVIDHFIQGYSLTNCTSVPYPVIIKKQPVATNWHQLTSRGYCHVHCLSSIVMSIVCAVTLSCFSAAFNKANNTDPNEEAEEQRENMSLKNLPK